MAALLSSCIGDTDSVVKYINEARELGLEILPPDVNESNYKFTVIDDKKVRFGLGAIRNVGKSAIDSILAARGEEAVRRSFVRLCARVDLRLCNKRVFEALIGSGALDALGGHRAQYLAILDTALQEASLKAEEPESARVRSLAARSTSGAPSRTARRPAQRAADDRNRAAQKEKEILGFYTSGHPLEPFRIEAELFATHTVSPLGKWTEKPITLAVVITAVKKQVSKKSGNEFAR